MHANIFRRLIHYATINIENIYNIYINTVLYTTIQLYYTIIYIIYSGEIDGMLIGNKGYQLTGTMLTPFRGRNNTPEQTRFNKAHSKTRVKVEHTFGMVKARFYALAQLIRVKSPQQAARLITICCILHNIALMHGDIIEPPEVVETMEEDNVHPRADGNIVAQEMRNAIMRTLAE